MSLALGGDHMTLSKKSFFVILCLQALATAPLPAQSQAITGSIDGVVTGQTSAVVPKAEVTLLNTETDFTRRLTTPNEGRFRAVLLPLGQYKVTAGRAKFGPLVGACIQLG